MSKDWSRKSNPFAEERTPAKFGSMAPGDVEDEFNVTLSEIEQVELRALHESMENQTYYALTADEKDHLRSALEEKYTKSSVANLYEMIWDWKESVGKNWQQAQTLELVAKKALGTEAPVRHKNEKDPEYTGEPIDPDDSRIDIYKDLVRVSRAFFRVRESRKDIEDIDSDFNPVLDLYRGPGHGAPRFLVALFDYPNQGFIDYEQSVLTGYSSEQDIGKYYGDSVLINDLVPLNHLAVAVDFVLPTPYHEAELHIDNFSRKIATQHVRYVGRTKQHPKEIDVAKISDKLSIERTVEKIRKSTDPDARDLLIFTDLVQLLWDKGVSVETQSGVEVLRSAKQAFGDASNTQTIMVAEWDEDAGETTKKEIEKHFEWGRIRSRIDGLIERSEVETDE